MELVMRQGGTFSGYLNGPSHEAGGIPAIVDGIEPIELEGGEIVINAATVKKLGADFFLKLNATASPYHNASEGFSPGTLRVGNKSIYRDGGYISKYNSNIPDINFDSIEEKHKSISLVQKMIKGNGFVDVFGWARPVNKSAWNTYTGKYKSWSDRHRIYRTPVHIAMNWKELEVDHGD
jgi:hypothetical protein